MKVEVRLFAILRERAGAESLALELADDATVADAIAALRREPSLAGLAELPFRIALNREYADDGATIRPGDELAAIPPVSGGAQAKTTAPVHARVTEEPLDLAAVARIVSDRAAGAIVTFQGITRDVDKLAYEAYAEMAQRRIEAILRDCAERHELRAAAAEHRIGEVPLSHPSVIVAVSAAHREEAFAGAREAIARIKAEAPIWKKEISGREGNWVPGELP